MATRPEPVGGRSVDLAGLHRAHYRDLVKLASLLISDVGRCEELAQEAFVQLAARARCTRRPRPPPTCARRS